MWQEARKHEKHIRSVLVDYRKRAERRLSFYSQIRQDPIKFLRVYGAPAKINLDVDVRKAAENPAHMMTWVGDPSILIDRFDVRANLDTYTKPKPLDIKKTTEEKIIERICNYESYRCLAHNDFLEITEQLALKQIEREEKYSDSLSKKHDDENPKDKKPAEPKAAIGFTYEEGKIFKGKPMDTSADPTASSDESDLDSDVDFDVELDLETLTAEQKQDIIGHSHIYGMKRSDFVRLLDADQVLESELRMAKILEEEKSQHLRKPRRRFNPRTRQPFDKYAPAPSQGPKIGLLNGQPITRRKVYLSGASSDSDSYGSPSSEEELKRDQDNEGGGEGRPQRRPYHKPRPSDSQLARTQPSLFDSKRPAVLIGGLTLVAFCDPKKRRRRFRDRPRRRSAGGDSTKIPTSSSSRSSSSSDDSRHHRRSKLTKVEYITTFGNEDDDEEDDDVNSRVHSLVDSGLQNRARPSATATKLAASVVSTLFKRTPKASAGRRSPVEGFRSRDVPSSTSVLRRRQRSTSPSESRNSRRRRRSSSSRSTSRSEKRRPHNRHSRSSTSSPRSNSRRPPPAPLTRHRRSSRSLRSSSSSSSSSASLRSPHPPKQATPSPSFRNRSRSQSHGKNVVDTVPVKRYYRRDLESEDGKSKLSEASSSSSSSNSDDDGRGRYGNSRTAGKPSYGQGRRESTTFTDADGRRRYSNNLGEAGDFFPGGKRPSNQHQVVDRYSNPPNPSSSSYSLKDSRPPAGKVASSATSSKLTPQELMKRRMQAQLNRTADAEKKAEQERLMRQERERLDREEGLRKLANQMRAREIEKRLAERGITRSFSPSPGRSRSHSPPSPAVPPALNRGRAGASPPPKPDSESGDATASRGYRLHRPPSPFRRRDFQNRRGATRR